MNNKDRFYSRKWGVLTHCLYNIQNNPKLPHSYGKHTSWDEVIDGFDTEELAKTLHEVSAGYVIFTVMQGKRYMIAPNSAFDKIAETKPGEACSSRDLIEDLYQSLSKYDIDLFLYFTSKTSLEYRFPPHTSHGTNTSGKKYISIFFMPSP